MKKLFCIILSALLLLSFSLCSCGGEEQSKPTDVSEKTSEAEKSEPADVSKEESKKEESKEESKEVSEAHKHSYTEEITKEPTCTAKGEKTFKCECGDTYTEEIAAAGHKYKETVTKEATCVDAGEKELECSVCGKKETKEIKAAGHKYKEEVTKKATCTDDGVKEIKCSVCGDSKTEAIKATGHSWKNATCTDPKKCKNCGLTEGDALGHDYKGKETKGSSCDKPGKITYTCTRCKDSYSETLPAEHKFVDGVCSRCNALDDYTGAIMVAVKEYFKKNLKNPASLQLTEIYYYICDDDPKIIWVTIKYSAMNGFGGYNQGTQNLFIKLLQGGKFTYGPYFSSVGIDDVSKTSFIKDGWEYQDLKKFINYYNS